MKKLLLLAIISFLSIATIFAQEETKLHRHEIGVDISQMINRLIGSDLNFASNAVLYRKYYDNNKALRLSLGGRYNFYTTENQDRRQYISFTPRLGIERQLDIHDKWEAYYGIDGFVGYTNSRDTNPNANTLTSLASYSGGFSVIGGLRYRFTERISLFTEMGYIVVYRRDRDIRETNGNTISDVATDQFFTSFNYPLNLSLAVRF